MLKTCELHEANVVVVYDDKGRHQVCPLCQAEKEIGELQKELEQERDRE